MSAIYWKARATKDAKGNWQLDPEGEWRFLSVPNGAGKPPAWLATAKADAAKIPANGKRGFQHRLPDGRWSLQQFKTIESARNAAEGIRNEESSLQIAPNVSAEEMAANPNRIPLRSAVEKYLARRAKNHKDRTITQYTYILTEFLTMLPRMVRFVDQIEDARSNQQSERTSQVLADYQERLEADGASKRTVHNKMLVVAFMLKSAGVETPTKLMTLPKMGKKIAVPYTREELGKIMAEVADEDKLAMDFFLCSGVREQECQHAQWQDIDFSANKYHVREKLWAAPNGLRKSWTVKNYEDRFVPLSTDVVNRLKQRKTAKGSNSLWIFPNNEGQPDGHMLRILKNAAKKAGVTGEIKLHRLRKTAATRWVKQGVPVRTIQAWLGHKSLETTQIYLGVEDFSTQQNAINAPAY
jgi:integrase